jgi:hypothetical protein
VVEAREGTCLLLAPHHDVGFTDDVKQKQMEYRHHGDALVPRQQRFGQYTRSLMKALDVPVHNRWGLRPARAKDSKEIAPLTAYRDIDELGLLKNVPTLNFHPHLPHYELTDANLPPAGGNTATRALPAAATRGGSDSSAVKSGRSSRFQTATSALARSLTRASVWNGVGVMRMRATLDHGKKAAAE